MTVELTKKVHLDIGAKEVESGKANDLPETIADTSSQGLVVWRAILHFLHLLSVHHHYIWLFSGLSAVPSGPIISKIKSFFRISMPLVYKS